MTIDWDSVLRGWMTLSEIRKLERKLRAWTAPTFTQQQIKAAQKAVKAMKSPDDDPNHVPSLWPPGDGYPDISQIDFGDATQQVLNLADLKAANGHDWLNRSKLLQHLAHPGDSMLKPNPFTQYPIICKDGDGELLIIDGHHRLGALMLLGATTWLLWVVPQATS